MNDQIALRGRSTSALLLLLAGLIFFPGVCRGDDRDALETAKQSFAADMARIDAQKAALETQYVQNLETLFTQAMNDKDLDTANDIRDEINRIRDQLPVTPEDLKRGLILYYKFDHDESDTITDESGYGNNGHGVGVQWVSFGNGGGMQFNQTGSYITVPNNPSLNPREFTMSAWIKTNYTDSIWRRIFDKGTGIGYVLSMCGDDKGKSFEGQVDIEGGKGWVGSGVRVADGNWHHVAGVYNGRQLFLYVDGKPVGRPSRNVTVRSNDFDLTIGANRSNPDASLGEVGASFTGTMTEIRMYDRALSAREIGALHELHP